MVSQIHFLYKNILCEMKICGNDIMLVCKSCVNSSFTALMCILDREVFCVSILFAKKYS